ncbi:type 1 glutamine amidotransferase [Sphingomonas jatrophae]|uniref:type 1 glutamine amidotransferase n=1 Tax=Sphingomonas jatrophae TaxID=1166337 RepID=UPI001F621AAE|nr:type 1 glutamine amidotransferase [Sphingomonas jatrophae]
MRLLIAESEPEDARRKRRKSVGRSSGETFEALLRHIVPNASFARVWPADGECELPGGDDLASFDGVLLTGSPIHLYEDVPETRGAVEFMRAVYDAGLPAFGSCAGLQLATVAAGGKVRAMEPRREAGFARRIYATAEGARHPLLAGRPPAFDAPAVHTDEVAELPDGAVLLASNAVTRVQAAEICSGDGVFWGVQYHPEISLFEIAGALERQADDLVEHRLAPSAGVIGTHAALLRQLHNEPERTDLLWRLGLDREVTDPDRRSREIANFLERLVLPTRSRRVRDGAVRVPA